MIGISLSLPGVAAPNKGGGVTALRREADGTVTVLSVAAVSWRPNLTRQGDGTVLVA